MTRVAGTLETMELPRSPPKTVPPARAAVLLTQELPQDPVSQGSEALPSRPPPQGQLPCFQGTIC